MIEDSVESFVLQFKPYAVPAELIAGSEGSPLIECVVQTKVLHFLERTGPYLSSAGKKNIILNCSALQLNPNSETEKAFEISGLSRLKVKGLILELFGNNLVVDAGLTLIVSCLSGQPNLSIGDWVQFESIAPIHGFVLSDSGERPRYVEEDGI